MIPKTIHYCWFGKNDLDVLSKACISTWEKYLPDYKIIRWDESNFDVNHNPYLFAAYQQKKWAFVSDYVRAYALYHHGGIYLDTDVEIRRSLDDFLSHRAFSGFEITGFPFTAVWGAEKNHNWPGLVLSYYDKQQAFTLTTNTKIVSEILEEHYRVKRNEDRLQELEEGIYIYPSSAFCIDLPMNYACHHFNGSWEEKNEVLYKDLMRFYYYENQYFSSKTGGTDHDFQIGIAKKVKFKYLIKELKDRLLQKILLK
ncbi:glycosyl transferase [Pedobacter sp. HDW13]|uniref:glycosyltransferase family 32 protein n=1 Tax=Pedobacter sp. HDW13 TaxID=2714940 RepID=UPI00140C1C27|nr:glycosyltransferase [Pedobacter sp. HDW13]QIL40678.1 glycosyl transferase [Pedobacter sp. HDW13]